MFLGFFVPTNPKKLREGEWDEFLTLVEEEENLGSDSESKRKCNSSSSSDSDIELVDKDNCVVANRTHWKEMLALFPWHDALFCCLFFYIRYQKKQQEKKARYGKQVYKSKIKLKKDKTKEKEEKKDDHDHFSPSIYIMNGAIFSFTLS